MDPCRALGVKPWAHFLREKQQVVVESTERLPRVRPYTRATLACECRTKESRLIVIKDRGSVDHSDRTREASRKSRQV